MKKNLFPIVCCLIAGLLSCSFLSAQRFRTPTLSPFTTITQEIGLTEIKITYSRPSMKGRKVFGALVPYGEVWRTAANASTKLTFTEDVKIGGNPLKAGTYALYTIPGESSWTIIIHSNLKHRSLAGGRYKQEEDVFRFEVKPTDNPLTVETFTIVFADLTSKSCNVQLVWENTLVNFPIEVDVDAQIEAQIADFAKDPEKVSGNSYFRAAEYYLNNQKDLKEALRLSDLSTEKNPKSARFFLLKAKILARQGKTKKAIKVADAGHQLAKDANNANYMDQTKTFIENLKKEK